MQNGKKSGIGILSPVILLTISLGMLIGCTAADTTVSEVQKQLENDMSNDVPVHVMTSEQERAVITDTDIPDIVREEAGVWTVEEYEYAKQVSVGNNYSD